MVYAVSFIQVLKEGVIEIESIIIVQVQLCEVAMNKMNVIHFEGITGFQGIVMKLLPLFHPIKGSRRIIHTTYKTEFTHPTANIQDPLFLSQGKEMCSFTGNTHWRPVPL